MLHWRINLFDMNHRPTDVHGYCYKVIHVSVTKYWDKRWPFNIFSYQLNQIINEHENTPSYTSISNSTSRVILLFPYHHLVARLFPIQSLGNALMPIINCISDLNESTNFATLPVKQLQVLNTLSGHAYLQGCSAVAMTDISAKIKFQHFGPWRKYASSCSSIPMWN